MSEKRKVRPAEVRISEIDTTIERHERLIKELKAKRERAVADMERENVSDLLHRAQKAGLTYEDIRRKLGI